jgi:CRISPR system Cascade subunit CasB
MSVQFNRDSSLGTHLLSWWSNLAGRPGERAELRRAATVADVVMTPAFQRACAQFASHFKGEIGWEDRFAAIIGLLAHVREPSSQNLAEQMAGRPPVVSELRFRRLLQRDRGDFYVAMIRVIRMLKYRANVIDLAKSVYYWGDSIKKEWAYAYFPKTPANTSK